MRLPVFLRVALLLAGLSLGPLQAAPPSFSRQVIDQQGPKSPWIKIIGDLDKDGRTDVIVGGAGGPLVWYANPSWKKSLIATGGYDSVDGEAADIDRDGDLDLVIGGVHWYENPLPAAKPDAGAWTAHRIAKFRTHDVEVADLDGDGRLDVVVRDQSGFGHKTGNRIMLFRQRSPDDWAPREVACPHGEGLEVQDLNRDGRPDLVIGARWYENPGKPDGPWAEHVYAAGWREENVTVGVGDFNGDGRPDVALAPAEFQGGRYRIAWFEAPADARQSGWKEHVVEPQIETVVHSLRVADVDGDGRADLVTAMMHQGGPPQEVSVYLNGDRGVRWTKLVLSTKGSHNLVVADLDGDGRLDVLGANHGGPYQPVEWWRNLPVKPAKQERESIR